MITIHNIEKAKNIGSSINKKNWHISKVIEGMDADKKDVYAFAVEMNGSITNIFYLNRDSSYVSGRNEPVYRLYKDFDQSKINRWLSKEQIHPYFIGNLIDEMRVIAKMEYEHPVFTIQSLKAARYLRDAGGQRLAFAGAHLGWGFHEDGARSGIDAARKFGATW